MRILLSNDDGYFAPGLAALAQALEPLGEITVVAPERDRSGASNSLTLDRPLSLHRASTAISTVNARDSYGTGSSATVARHRARLVVSGINSGSNMGDDTLYSVSAWAAATEGYLLGLPAIAFACSW